jgi:hypothetical protein
MASAHPSAQTLRRILIDLEVGGRATFDKDERRLVLKILLDLVERVVKLEEDTEQARRVASKVDKRNLPSRKA